MSRKMIIILGCCFLCATVLVVTLYATTYKIVHEKNSFLREYINFAAVKASEMNVEYNSWYIAGITDDKVYLGNITAALHVLIVNHTLTDSQRVQITFPNGEQPDIYRGTHLRIYPPYFFLTDGVSPVIYRGKIGEWQAQVFMNDSAYFSKIVAIGPGSFAVRSLLSENRNNVLGTIGYGSHQVKLNRDLLQKQVDGFFCTDGTLIYNPDLHELIYTYYYRNEYIVFDTLLNLKYRAHTIDTFSRAQITVQRINSESSSTLTNKKLVNVLTATSGHYLYVRSDLLAKNDDRMRFERESIFDLYDLNKGTYHGSISISKQDEKHVRDFLVYNNSLLFALHHDRLVRYDLRSNVFQ